MNFGIIILCSLFSFVGLHFYSSMYAAIGSAVDNETETQQFTMIGILPLMLGNVRKFWANQ